MIKAKKAAIAALVCTMVLGAGGAALAGCNKKPQDTIHDDIVNGGFEQGDLTGWKTAGDYAFDADGVVEAEAVEGLGVTVGGKVGTYYFNGLAATNATSTGTLTSEPFKLGGTGKIGFKVGAGSDASKCYVEFIEHGTDTVLKKVSNEAYDAGFIDDDLVRVVVDLSEHIGKNIYIKVTDNGSTQKSHEYFHLDDFVMYKTEAEITAANKERNDYIKMYGRPVFENDTPTAKTVKNGNFEDGLNNWQILEGDAYTPRAIVPSTNKFWDTREYNAEGNYFLDGFAVGEDRTGAIRSTTFTLAEMGVISFLLSSSPQNPIYVAVCNDEAIGDIAKDTELFKVSAKEVFKDNELSENMLRRYINASSYTPDGGEEVSLLGKKLYIKLVDNSSVGDLGFHAICFDDVRCSMTEAEVLALEKADYEWAMALTGRGDGEIQYTQDYYTNYNYPVALPVMRFINKANSVAVKAGLNAIDLGGLIENVTAIYGDVEASAITYKVTKVNYKGNDITTGLNAVVFDTVGLATVTYQAEYEEMVLTETFEIEVTNENQISNGTFELGNLAGWTYTQGAGNGQVRGEMAICADETFWNENISFNKSGKYFFNGWNANPEEKNGYTLKSTVFKLGGSGVISFKMGGNAAAVRVYYEGGNLLAEYKNTEFADVEFPHVEKGGRWATMTTFYADLHEYLGLNLYIELVDTGAGGWGVAFFDDIITYYEGDTETVLATLVGKEDAVHYACKWSENDEPKSHEGATTIPWVAAVNTVTPELIQITTKVTEYNEINGEQNAYDLSQYLTDITGGVIGVANPTINKAITKVSDGTTDYTTSFNAFNLEGGKTYTVTYTLTYNDGTEDYTASATFTVKVISQYEVQNGGFELGNLSGWTVVSGDIDINEGVSTADHNDWVEHLPYNKTGNYFCANAGLGEHTAWELKSSTFTLGGNGFISFKMASNNAILKVFKADGTQVYEYTCQTFADVGFPHVENGGNWCTLRTHYADLSAYKGEQLYITIGNTGAGGGWEFGYFDDIVTYYAEGEDLSTKQDDVLLTCVNGEGSHEEGETTPMDWIEAENEYVEPSDDNE